MSENVIKLEGGFPWGFRLVKNNRLFKISSIIGNSKAHLSGLEIGDVVQDVNGNLVLGWTHEKLMDVIKSAEKLELKIQKNGNSKDQVPDQSYGSKYFNFNSTFEPIKADGVINNNLYEDSMIKGTNDVYQNKYEYDSKWNQNVKETSVDPKNASSSSKNSYSMEPVDKSGRILEVTSKAENEKIQKEWYKNFHNIRHAIEPEEHSIKKTIPRWNAKDHEDPFCLNIVIKRTEGKNEVFSKTTCLDREILEVTKPTLGTLRNIENYEPFDSENNRNSVSQKRISLHQWDHENIADGKDSTISWNTRSNSSVENPDISNKKANSMTAGDSRFVKSLKHSFNQSSLKPHSEGILYPENINSQLHNKKNNSRVNALDEDVSRGSSDGQKVRVNGFDKRAKVAKALQSYTGTRIEELSFKQNDFITIINQLNDQWYEGRLGIRKGLVPVKFVQLVKEQEKPPIVPKEAKRFEGSLEKIVNIYQREGIRSIAVKDVEPRNSDELKLTAGEQILVKKIFDDGWTYGTSSITNSSGLFLSKWVKLLED